jgi:hypothetical protein
VLGRNLSGLGVYRSSEACNARFEKLHGANGNRGGCIDNGHFFKRIFEGIARKVAPSRLARDFGHFNGLFQSSDSLTNLGFLSELTANKRFAILKAGVA